MKFVVTFVLFVILFVASANESVINATYTNSKVDTYSNFTQNKSHFILNSSGSHRDYEFVIDVEEEDEKSKWLLAVIYTFLIESSEYKIKTDSNCFYFTKNIIPKQPRHLLLEVFIV